MTVLRFREPGNQTYMGYETFLEKIGTVVTNSNKSFTPNAVSASLESMFGICASREIIVATLDFMYAFGYLRKQGDTYSKAHRY